MRALAIVHQRDAGPGVFAEAIAAREVLLEEWMPTASSAPPCDLSAYGAVLTFGGAMHPDQEREHPWLAAERRLLADAVAAGIPVLGACLGAQVVCAALGGEPHRLPTPEIGWHEVELTDAAASDPVLGFLPRRFVGFQWHSYACTLPDGAVELARSPVCLQAFRARECAWAIQFHAEVTAADACSWADQYRSDPDAVRIGIDPGALKSEIHDNIAGWNELGREIAGRFVDWAAARARAVPPGRRATPA